MINIETIDEKTLCSLFDHTCLKPDAVEADFIKLCNEAKDNHFKMVAINSYPVKLCKSLLKDSDVHVGAAIGFYLGQNTIESKCFETIQAIKDGADEIDYVVNIGRVKDHDYEYIKREMNEIVSICRDNNVLVKVIFENCYLEKEEIGQLSLIAKEVKPDFIKTSTGFGTYGAKVEDVLLMKETVEDEVKVKAAGGIRDWDTCRKMIEAGAERIGTSSSLIILEQFKKERNYG